MPPTVATIQTFLSDTLGPFGPLLAIGGLGLVMVLGALSLIFLQKPDPLDRLKTRAGTVTAGAGQARSLRSAGKNPRLDKYASFLEPQDKKQLSEIRLKLMQAGYRHRDAVRYYHALQMGLAVGLLVLGVGYFLLFKSGQGATINDTVLYILGPGVAGYMVPKIWVTKRRQARQQEIQDGFPDSLDMMLVCIEAGQSLDQAIIRVGRELRASFPALAEEYEIVSLQAKAGRDKRSVLTEMGERCGVQDISSFVAVLIQSQTFGTSIGEALRVYAGEMRDKRVMRAEEKANKLPTKMTLATMMLTVPPLLIILVGPSVLGIMELLSMSR